VDYPGVTKVIQVGAPKDRNTYIHRIGRTGRAGKLGDTTMILAPFEKNFLNSIRDLPITDHELPASEIEIGEKEQKVFESAKQVLPPGMIEDTYMSLFGYCEHLLYFPG
jgi:ATP-dependent RNA helicase MSS116, mitochondrial